MRNEEQWEKLKWKYIAAKFPLRVQKDFQKLDLSEVKRTKESVFLYGEVETGKTLFACQLLMAELKYIYLHSIQFAHNKTLFVSFSDMLEEIKATFGGSEKTNEVMEKYLGAHFLVIDDFLTARPTDWVLEILYHLINYRYENMKTTIITSNNSLIELENILQEQRIVSRINRSYKIVEKIKIDTKIK